MKLYLCCAVVEESLPWQSLHTQPKLAYVCRKIFIHIKYKQTTYI